MKAGEEELENIDCGFILFKPDMRQLLASQPIHIAISKLPCPFVIHRLITSLMQTDLNSSPTPIREHILKYRWARLLGIFNSIKSLKKPNNNIRSFSKCEFFYE